MSAVQDQNAELALTVLRVREGELSVADEAQKRAKLLFMREALAAAWDWTRIGEALGQTDRAVSRYWARNRMQASRIGGIDEADQAA